MSAAGESVLRPGAAMAAALILGASGAAQETGPTLTPWTAVPSTLGAPASVQDALSRSSATIVAFSTLDERGPATDARRMLDAAARAGREWSAPAAQEQKERWSSFLPLLKEEALARGHQLPLPFGAGITATVLANREIDVTDLRIGVDGEPPTSVSRAADLGSKSDVFNANLKLDAWILPFLNVYTLLGYVYNESDTKVHVEVPRPGMGTIEFDLAVESELDGFVGGGGLTLAGGYDAFFLVVDSNYSQTDIGFDDSFRAITASMRAGMQTELGGTPLQAWLGGSYWDTENTAKGHADVSGVGRVDFEADQGPTYPWVIDLGANVRFSPSFEFFVDVATDLHGGIIATVGPVFRF